MIRIVAAALRFGDFIVFKEAPARHHDIFHAMEPMGIPRMHWEQGFITSGGMFVNRVDGLKIAKVADQIEKRKHGNLNELFSEDLW